MQWRVAKANMTVFACEWVFLWLRIDLIFGGVSFLLDPIILFFLLTYYHPFLGLSSCRRPFSIVQNIYHLCMANFFSCSRRVCWTDCTGHISDGTKCAFPWYRTLLVLCSVSCILLVVAVFFVRPRLTEFFLPFARALCLLLPFLMRWGDTSYNSVTFIVFHVYVLHLRFRTLDRRKKRSGKTIWSIVSTWSLKSVIFISRVTCGLQFEAIWLISSVRSVHCFQVASNVTQLQHLHG